MAETCLSGVTEPGAPRRHSRGIAANCRAGRARCLADGFAPLGLDVIFRSEPSGNPVCEGRLSGFRFSQRNAVEL